MSDCIGSLIRSHCIKHIWANIQGLFELQIEQTNRQGKVSTHADFHKHLKETLINQWIILF